MKYRTNPKNGDSISALAFGFMRLNGRSESEIAQLVAYAVESGVNYFDTAYVYPGSESALGRALAAGYRDRVKIATKLPPYQVKSRDDAERIFRAQLQRLRTGWIDYYLIHMLTSENAWRRLEALGIREWIEEKKAAGLIRNIGFSYHGGREMFRRLVDAYDWEFCMIQYNYLDELNQAGRSGLEYAASKGLPVMVMEPLRGGTLAGRMPKEAGRLLREAAGERSPAEWGLRWVWNHSEVVTALSGMNSMAMLKENVRVASEAEAGTMSERELGVLAEARDVIRACMPVPCTGCAYCMPCPAGVDIPSCFSAYNDVAIEGRLKSLIRYAVRISGHEASLCVKCGRCEPHCPQSIDIRRELAAVKRRMEGPLLRPLHAGIRSFLMLQK
ncbi:MAG: aldo/keto reductase [Clostridiales Family XIII bacterium]|jgi:predicted aldo/keto reductase-like oxidoreductase|nr:aldo/keto reductase [Clostridiales Family XIII bacterium]